MPCSTDHGLVSSFSIFEMENLPSTMNTLENMKPEKEKTQPIEERLLASLRQKESNSSEIELEFLNLLLNNTQDIPKVMALVKEEDFTTEVNKTLFNVIVACYRKYNGPFSSIHLMGEISLMNYTSILPINIILSLQSRAATLNASAVGLAKIIFEISMLRRLLSFASWIYEKCESNDSKDMGILVAEVKAELEKITEIPQFQTESLRTVVSELKQSLNNENQDKSFLSVTTGNKQFDTFFRLCPKEYIVIGARQKSGKTKLLIRLITLIFQHNKNVSVFWISIEDDKQKIIRNMVAAMTGIKVDNIERNRLSPDQRRMVNECYSIIENWDLEIHYEKPTVDVASMKYARFIKNRKERFNIFIYDNFNGAVDVEKNGSNTTERSERVAGNFQTILTNGNQNGYNTMMIILDHLKKDYNRDEAEKVGYRPNQSDLISSERKLSVLTQLVMINKPGIFKTFVDAENKKSTLFYDGKTMSRGDILSRLMIVEMNLNRNGGIDNNEDNAILRINADLGTMQFHIWPDDRHCSITKSDVMNERGIDNPDKLTFEMVRDEFYSLNQIGDIEALHRELSNILGHERKDKLGIITFDFLLTRYKEYVSYFGNLQNDKFTKKENQIEKGTEWIFKGLYNNRYIKPTTGDDAARDSYLYNIV